jgi:hypothetical protein
MAVIQDKGSGRVFRIMKGAPQVGSVRRQRSNISFGRDQGMGDSKGHPRYTQQQGGQEGRSRPVYNQQGQALATKPASYKHVFPTALPSSSMVSLLMYTLVSADSINCLFRIPSHRLSSSTATTRGS